jgi:hypothetical protein
MTRSMAGSMARSMTRSMARPMARSMSVESIETCVQYGGRYQMNRVGEVQESAVSHRCTGLAS